MKFNKGKMMYIGYGLILESKIEFMVKSLPSINTLDLLPKNAENETIYYVKSEKTAYFFKDNCWYKLGENDTFLGNK